ncbi:MAG: non-canonical purine NTP pyrophosphatase [Phycisphaeraceae bacterium]
MRIIVATSNLHKLQEIREIFEACAAEDGLPAPDLATLDMAGVRGPEPTEDADTFEGNAALKARHYASTGHVACLADDSGLEVDALGGQPGVLSARYSGETGPRREVDLANNATLMHRLGDIPAEQRTARFVCVMALAMPDEPALVEAGPAGDAEPGPRIVASVRGTVEGRIITAAEADDPAQLERGRGDQGFGYDPLFFVPELGKTTAEISPEAKNRISHRGHAARAMFRDLRRLWTAPSAE